MLPDTSEICLYRKTQSYYLFENGRLYCYNESNAKFFKIQIKKPVAGAAAERERFMETPYLMHTREQPGPASFLMKRVAERNGTLMRSLTIEEQREAKDRLADVRVLMPGVAEEEVTCAGIPCQWFYVKNGLHAEKVIVYIHGGSWIFGSLKTAKAFGVMLAGHTRCRVLVVDYRLAPEYPWPAGLDDCLTVYQWLLTCGYREQDIALMGDSAGGNLSLCLLNRLKALGFRQPACAALASPVTDVRKTSAVIQKGEDLIYTRHEDREEDIFSIYVREGHPDGADREEPLVSPIMGDLTGLAPVLIHVGEEEALVRDNIAYGEKMFSQGGDVLVKVYRGMFHDFTIVGRTLKESRESVAEMAVFLQKHLLRE